MRLIDADELLERLKATDRYFMVKFDIERAPTIDQWHYPSKGELPEKSGEYLVKVNYHDGTPPFKSVCEFDTKYRKWCFYGNKDIVAWQYIVPPKEEA